MLQELTIQNLALIEKLTLNFKTGFSALTGETGAGKSILLDALGLTLGERADSALVRHNTPRADVSALFDIEALPQVQAWLAEQDLDDEQLCYLRRTVSAEGRSKAYINGRPIPASHLKTLGNMLIDIHGQHEHQSLLNPQQQLGLLDAYAAHPQSLSQTRQAFKHWRDLNAKLQQLQNDQVDYQNRLELLTFQQNEFDDIAPLAGEFEELSDEHRQLAHATEIKQACQQAYDAIEGEQGAADLLNQAIHALENIIEFSPALEGSLAQLNSALIEAQEAASEIQNQAESVEIDPLYLQTIEERLSQLFSLAKQYHIDPQALPEKQRQIEEALQQLQDSDQSLEQLKTQIDQAWSDYCLAAEALSQSRGEKARQLAEVVSQGMQQLGMPNGEFEIQLSAAAQPGLLGTDKIEFMVSANKGMPLQPLAKVASGGELSRISLAIQVATAEVASLPTLIFDEVDVGIGGGIAEVVGQKMRQLGQHKQILSITHLAQVASHGHSHLHIAKQTEDNQTFTQVIELDESGRVEELARMMGGLKITEQTRNHAREMLQSAQSTLSGKRQSA
jgi:DNA repair protein RecN (Recombination protein N)